MGCLCGARVHLDALYVCVCVCLCGCVLGRRRPRGAVNDAAGPSRAPQFICITRDMFSDAAYAAPI